MTKLMEAQLLNQWLRYCLSIGWKKSDLDDLQHLFYKYRGWETFKGGNYE